jgi:hypothetical protein
MFIGFVGTVYFYILKVFKKNLNLFYFLKINIF